MSSEAKFPQKDGWLHGKLTIEKGTELSQEVVIKFFTGDDPDLYEVADFKHFKTVVRIIFRKIRLSKDQMLQCAHALGIEFESKKKKVRHYNRNYFSGQCPHLDLLVGMDLAVKSAPLEIYDGDSIYRLTSLGMKVFSDNLKRGSWYE